MLYKLFLALALVFALVFPTTAVFADPGTPQGWKPTARTHASSSTTPSWASNALTERVKQLGGRLPKALVADRINLRTAQAGGILENPWNWATIWIRQENAVIQPDGSQKLNIRMRATQLPGIGQGYMHVRFSSYDGTKVTDLSADVPIGEQEVALPSLDVKNEWSYYVSYSLSGQSEYTMAGIVGPSQGCRPGTTNEVLWKNYAFSIGLGGSGQHVKATMWNATAHDPLVVQRRFSYSDSAQTDFLGLQDDSRNEFAWNGSLRSATLSDAPCGDIYHSGSPFWRS